MDRPMPQSLQEVIRLRQQSDFVGREQPLADFRANLDLPLDDERRRFIFNVYGPTGVGKTWLLRRFDALARQAGMLTVWSDDSAPDLVAVMEQIVAGFETQGCPLAALSERLRAYRLWRPALEISPERVTEFAPFTAQILVKRLAWETDRGGPRLVVPVNGSPVHGAATATLAGDARWSRTDDESTELIRTLTPLFVDSLRLVARKVPVALFFDGYERIGRFLDDWLRAILEGRFGELPLSLILGIAGQERLALGRWGPFESILARIPLDVFTEDEVRLYLARKGIYDERTVATIVRLSGRQPVLVATLALGGDRPEPAMVRPLDAVSHFLAWVTDPIRQGALLEAAIPRRINVDLLAQLVGRANAEEVFQWIRGLPFVEERAGECVYRKAVRADLLRYLRRELPERWGSLQAQLATYYEQLMDNLHLPEADRRQNPTWQSYATDALYHRLGQAPREAMATALSGFVAAFGVQPDFARSWALTIQQAGEDVGDPTVKAWGERLEEAVDAYCRQRYAVTAETFVEMLASEHLDERWRLNALVWCSRLLFASGRLDQAVRSYQQLVAVAPEVPEHWVEKGITLVRRGYYQAALEDFDHALELSPGLIWALANRGETYRLLERYDDALGDFSAVLAQEPDNVPVLGSRGQVYAALGRYDEALADLTIALELAPQQAWILVERANVLRGLGRYEAALQDLNQALELDPSNVWARAIRGDVFSQLRQVNDAQEDFQRALAESSALSVASAVLR